MKRLRKAFRYFNKRWYPGKNIPWLISDKKRKSVYCASCGNIANGVAIKRTLIGDFNVPLCRNHISKFLPEVISVPCKEQYKGQLLDLIL